MLIVLQYGLILLKNIIEAYPFVSFFWLVIKHGLSYCQ